VNNVVKTVVKTKTAHTHTLSHTLPHKLALSHTRVLRIILGAGVRVLEEAHAGVRG